MSEIPWKELAPDRRFVSSSIREYWPSPDFIVAEFDDDLKQMAGAPYGLYNGDRRYCTRLFEDEVGLNDGRFEHFQSAMLAFDHSIADPGETEKLFNAAGELDKPWSFRLVSYRTSLRFTFSFQDDITAVEFKLRIG